MDSLHAEDLLRQSSAVVLATTEFFQKKFVKLKFLIIIFRWIPNAEDLLRLQVVATTILNTLNDL